jgi:hypothetical protein
MRVWLVLAVLLTLAGCMAPAPAEQDGGFGGTGVETQL